MSSEIKTYNDLFKRENILDLYRFSRFTYAIGKPILNDKQYNIVEKIVKKEYKDNKLLLQTYDEDTVPSDIFARYSIPLTQALAESLNCKKVYEHPRYEQIKPILDSAGTKSIEAYETYEDCWKWIEPRRHQKLRVSLKVDGVNTRSAIIRKDNQDKQDEQKNETVEYGLLCSSTRGRTGQGWDITEQLSRKFPKTIKVPKGVDQKDKELGDSMLVYGEAYVNKSALPYLKKKYNLEDKWVNPRSTALSILRVEIRPEDYQHLRFKVFNVSDLSDTGSEALTIAKKMGFDIVPWRLIGDNEIPDNYEDFRVWLKSLIDEFGFISDNSDIEADGIVIEVDNKADFMLEGSHNQYNTGNIAIKMERWGSEVYTSTIESFVIEGQKEQYSVKAIIKPVTVKSNGVTVRRVNCFNPRIIVDNKLLPGSEITFEYKSASNINLIYK